MAAPKKKTPKRATKKKTIKRSKYEQAMDDAIPQWLPYPGNKRQLVPILMNLLPSPVNRFVDLFGGTGITGVEAYKYGKCQQVIYNDLEYDMVLLLEWLYTTPIADIIDTYNAVWDRWFGDIRTIELFEEDTKKYKDSTGDRSGGAHTQIWRSLVDHYNANRIILWDRPEDAELKRIISAVENKDIRRQLSEYANGIQAENIELMGWDANKPQPTDEEAHRGWLEFLDQNPKIKESWDEKRARDTRERQARQHKQHPDIDIFAARGDFFLPGELLFIMLNTYMGQQKWAHLGRGREDKSPRTVGKNNRAAGHIRTVDNIIPFVKALKQTPISFYSHSFTEGWIDKAHERPRSRVAEERWRRMLASLDSQDIVFIDPPYHGSKAQYNKVYNQKLEIFLFAFCQLLDERDIPWVFTDNLIYENDIFKGWIENYYSYKLKPGALKLYNTKADASDGEIIVTNFKPAVSHGIPKEMLQQVTGRGLRDMLKWTSNGKRSR